MKGSNSLGTRQSVVYNGLHRGNGLTGSYLSVRCALDIKTCQE